MIEVGKSLKRFLLTWLMMDVPSKINLIGVRKMSTRRCSDSDVFRQAENDLFNNSFWNQPDEPEIEEGEEDE
tara:strand:- start:2294 stop:2509 length:216 start_codon:yes stop_codon:yes gene_type:complete